MDWQHRGFTLIELLVVMVIITIITTVAVLFVNLGGRDRALHGQSERLLMLLRLAQEQAFLTPTQIAFVYGDHSYHFLQYSQHKWLPIQQGPLHERVDLDPDQKLLVESAMPSISVQAQILFFSTYTQTPFTLHMYATSIDREYRIIGYSNGNLEISKQAEHD